MITCILYGGLGNRMAQILNVVIYSIKHNLTYQFFDKYSFNIEHNTNFHYKHNIFSKLNFEFTNFTLKDYWENKNNFVNNYTKDNLKPIDYKDIIYYNDNFIITSPTTEVNPEDFNKYTKYLFTNDDIINNLKNKYKNILNNSVAIHIRRGDFIERCPHMLEDYTFYSDSLINIEKEYNIDNILIFSDDIKWCKNTFRNNRIFFVEGQTDYEDMYLISLCDHFIGSNSSFSSLAYLISNNIKKQIIPQKWKLYIGNTW
jgi:Glycosyl transferase family 11